MTETIPVCATPSQPPRKGGRPKGSKDKTGRKRKRTPDSTRRIKDLLHKRFGHLTVISRGPKNQGKPGASVPALWYCVCDCGEIKLTNSRMLCRGEIKTCATKACPFKAALHTENLYKAKDNIILHTAMDKVGKVGFKLSADDVRKLLQTSCKLCGHIGPGHEIRCYEHSKGYTPSNSYSICDSCKGIVPISIGYHLTWPAVLTKLSGIIKYLTLTGDIAPGLDKAFIDKVTALEKAKPNEDLNDIPLAF